MSRCDEVSWVEVVLCHGMMGLWAAQHMWLILALMLLASTYRYFPPCRTMLPHRLTVMAVQLLFTFTCSNLRFSLLPASPPYRTMLPHCPTVMVVQNALADVRFSTNPLVLGFPHIRFYAGVGVQGQGAGSWEGACKGQEARGRGLAVGQEAGGC